MDKGCIEIFREFRFFASKEIWGANTCNYVNVHVYINRKNIGQNKTKWDKVQQYKINNWST